MGGGNQAVLLREWDLWGPLLFTLTLSSLLATGAPHPPSVFATVLGMLTVGALALTLNVALLGGPVAALRSFAVLGYAMVPLVVASLVCLIPVPTVRFVVLLFGLAWSSSSAAALLGASVPRRRRVLAIYPVVLLYLSVAWLALVR